MHKISFSIFRYYVEHYIKEINGGGSFDNQEFIDLL